MASSAGPSSATGPVPADVHFKMCKKVALLTKVVYHLNIKNEDNDAHTAALRRRHDEALTAVAADATEKIQRLEAQVAHNPEAQKLAVALKELTERFSRERNEAQAAVKLKEDACA